MSYKALGSKEKADKFLDFTSVVTDTRKAQKEDVFVAIKGTQYDSHQALGELYNLGLKKFIVLRGTDIPFDRTRAEVIEVPNTQRSLAVLARSLYHAPTSHLKTVGVTGTNGKTTMVHFLEAVLNAYGEKTAVMGTIDHHLGKTSLPSAYTTPPSLELQERIAEFHKMGATALATEVSSHAIDQERATGIDYDCAIFTNFTQDHLDYHKTMESYFAAKSRLFSDLLSSSEKKTKLAVYNRDDKKIAEYFAKPSLEESIEILSFGQSGDSDLRLINYKMTKQNTCFEFIFREKNYQAEILLPGYYNIKNALAALAVAQFFYQDFDKAILALKQFPGVPGRVERVPNSKGLNVYVDYAHTPDALINVLASMNQLLDKKSDEKIYCVFGCGGNRDKGKRPLMAKAVEESRAIAIVTSDNPRNEEPDLIIQEIIAGFSKNYLAEIKIEPDRANAIALALSLATCNDIVLIAGKGHEQYQEIMGEKKFFSDVHTVRETLG